MKTSSGGADKDEVLDKILHQDPISPRKKAPQRRIPPVLDSICMRAIQKDPALRYGSLAEMVDDLRSFLLHEEVSSHHYSLWERFLNWERRHTLLAVALAGLVIGIGLTLLLTLYVW